MFRSLANNIKIDKRPRTTPLSRNLMQQKVFTVLATVNVDKIALYQSMCAKQC